MVCFSFRTIRVICLVAVCGGALLTPTESWGHGREWFGDDNTAISSPWPVGVAEVLNSPGRVYGCEANGDVQLFWRGDASLLNRTLKGFFQIASSKKELIIRAGPGYQRTFSGKQVEVDWKLHAPGGRYLTEAQRETKTRVFSDAPVLVVYINPEKHLDLDKIEIPDGFEFITVKQLLERYLEGLNSPNTKVRQQAAYLLGTIQPLEEHSILPLIDRLDDVSAEVRYQAVISLGTFGIKAYAALPELRKLVNKEGRGLQNVARTAIEEIERGLDGSERRFRAITKEIELSIMKRKAGK